MEDSRNLGEKLSCVLGETVGAGNILQFHALSGQTKRGFCVPPSVCCFDSAWSERKEKEEREREEVEQASGGVGVIAIRPTAILHQKALLRTQWKD